MSGRIIGLVLLGLALAGCGDRFPDYRYKMTIYVDTPQGEKAFSSVREVRMSERRTILDSTGVTIERELEGEAVVLDLPSGPVFALLSMPSDAGGLGANYGEQIAEAALIPHISAATRDHWRHGRDKPGDPIADDAAVYQEMVRVKGPVELPRTRPTPGSHRGDSFQPLWPMFVKFGNGADPKTLQEVSPSEIGVRRITIENSTEDVTSGIDEILPDFGAASGFQEWVASLSYGDRRLGALGGFKSGEKQ